VPIANKFGFVMAYSIPNTLKRFIKSGKDKIEIMSQGEVVYKISSRL